MVRFSRVCLAAVLMCHPQVLEARKWMKDEEGNTLKSCDNHGGLGTLPRNSVECGARKGLAAQQPKLRQGRPSTPAAKQAARTKKRLAAQGAALFTQRYLFVQRHLNTTERKTLWRVSRGLPQFHALRAVMDQVYALFDRRCRTQTALDKLATRRRRVQRCKALGDTLKKLFAPTLEKALTFLDD